MKSATVGSRSLSSRAISCARCCYKTTSRTGSPARGGTFRTPCALVSTTCPLAVPLGDPLPRPWAPLPFPCSTSSPQAGSPTSGLDQDWSAIAATQCRLDKEGATKLVCDLITSTKNEKIFQESIGLAIRLLDGGNTEIQVWTGWGSWVVPSTRRYSVPRSWGRRARCWWPARVWLPVGSPTSHNCPPVMWPLFYPRRPPCSSQA